MKAFIAIFLLVIGLTSIASAATPVAVVVPTESVNRAPESAKVGEAVTLSAIIYNAQKQSVTYTVVFDAAGTLIGSTTILIPREAAKTASLEWKVPKDGVMVTATITKALTALKKDIATEHRIVGTVVVGNTDPLGISVNKEKVDQAKSWIVKAFSGLEVFRKKQALYFAIERDAARVRLGIDVVTQIEDKYANKFDNTPDPKNAPSATGVNTSTHSNDYFVMIYSSAFASYFGHIAFFYIASFLIVLLLLRIIWRMFI